MKIRKKCVIQSFVIILFSGILFSAAYCQPKSLYLYFVRHGQTNTNVEGLLVGISGNPILTEEGTRMAQALGVGLQDIKFDAAYSSTLTRAYDTACLVLEGAGQEETAVVQLDALRDISWGDAEGMTSEELWEVYGISSAEESFGTVGDNEFVSPIHAETKYEFCNRFEEAVQEIVSENGDGGTILIVAHSSMDFWFQKYFPEQAGNGVDNVSVTILEYRAGEFYLVDYNDVEYLQKGMEGMNEKWTGHVSSMTNDE